MSYRARFLLAALVFSGTISTHVPLAFAKGRPPLPSARFIAPAWTVLGEAELDAGYRWATNLFLERYPECERLRGYHRLTPGGSTIVITIRCTAIRRFFTRQRGIEAESLRLAFIAWHAR